MVSISRDTGIFRRSHLRGNAKELGFTGLDPVGDRVRPLLTVFPMVEHR